MPSRQHTLNTRTIPRMRSLGIAIWLVMVVIWELGQTQTLAFEQLTPLVLILVGYAALSAVALKKFYGRTGAVDLGIVFLFADIPMLLLRFDVH